jgi:putative ABC transport system ATP-binding protein
MAMLSGCHQVSLRFVSAGRSRIEVCRHEDDKHIIRQSSLGDNMIEIENITKIYRMGEMEVRALSGVSLCVNEGEWVAITGPSGSGKSTLMNIIGCLDQPTTGSYRLDGLEVGSMKDDQLAAVRNHKIGFVFQTFNLLSRTSALANVELPLVYAGVSDRKERRERSIAALQRVGLGERVNHRPNELSGGQQQRVAIARALINKPAIILADEPTGNLDSKSGAEIMDIFRDLNEQGLTIVMVTHDPDVSAQCQRIVRIKDGLIASDEMNGLGIPVLLPEPAYVEVKR